MKTQISRDTYQPANRYSGVYQQQGRMITDADWNALTEIVKRRLDEALVDVIGSGAPRGRGLGVIPQGTGFGFQGDHLYADGVHAQVAPARLGVPFAYDNQADFPAPPPLPSSSDFILYADIWERTVVSLEDPAVWVSDHLRDPALHGADTTTRTQTMAQIKWSGPAEPGDPGLNPPRQGDAMLSVELRKGRNRSDPCDPCAEVVTVTQRVGSYLFRLEIHDVAGSPDAPTEVILKWSSENGAEQHLAGTQPPDFTVGDYVYEFFDDRAEKHLGVHLASGFTPVRGQLLEAYPETRPAGFDRVRRWDGYAVLQRSDTGDWSLAKDGQGTVRGKDRETRLAASTNGENPGDVRLGSDRLLFHLRSLTLDLLVQNRLFVAGDYWLAPVRESAHALGAPVLREAPPLGIIHHYLRLAAFEADGKLKALSTDQDQQLHFPPLTEVTAGDVDYRPACPEGVFKPEGAFDTVQKALDRLCTLAATDIAFTEPCNRSLFSGVTVRTVADALHLLCDIAAKHVEYLPEEGCTLLGGLATVQQALDRLCKLSAADIPFRENCGTSLFSGVTVRTVAQALHLLCDIQARHVGYKAQEGCALFKDSRTVEQALNRLCTLAAADVAFRPPAGCTLFQGPTVTTVEQALARVCGITAENVAYTGCTSLDPKITTVKGALDAICGRPSGGGGGGCQVTVGKGGEFETLAVAVEDSLAAGKSDLCFRLLPGKNPVDGPLSVGSRVTHFTLSGCGLGSALTVTGNLTFSGVLSVRFEDLVLAVSPDRQIVVEGGDEVALERVLLAGSPRDPGSPPPVTLNAAKSMRVTESELRFWLFEGVSRIGDLFSSMSAGGALANLFEQRLDENFEAARPKEAARLAGLEPQDRARIADAASNTSNLESSFSEQESRHLSRFADLLRAPAASATALAQSLGDIRVAASESNPAFALVLIPGPGDATLVDNRILGLVSVYGLPGTLDLTLDEMSVLAVRLKSSQITIVPAAGRLFVVRNEVSRLVLGEQQIRQLKTLVGEVGGVYRAAFLAQNRFTAGRSRLLAKDARLTDNFFEPFPRERDVDSGAVIADTATFVGNELYEFSNVTRWFNAQTFSDLNRIVLKPDPYYLSDHPEALLQATNIHGGLQFRRVYWQEQVWISNVRYDHALGMHAPDGVGYADFRIPAGARFFRSIFGLARQDTTNVYGHAAGRILVDGQVVWTASLDGPAVTQTNAIRLPEGAKIIRLEVDGLGDNWADQTTWGDPFFSST